MGLMLGHSYYKFKSHSVFLTSCPLRSMTREESESGHSIEPHSVKLQWIYPKSKGALLRVIGGREDYRDEVACCLFTGRSPRSPISKLCQPDPVVVMHLWQVLIGRGPPVQPFPSCRAARTRVATVVFCCCCGNCSSPWSSAQARTTNYEEPSRSVRKPRCTAPCSWAVAAAQPVHLCCRVDAVDV